MAEHHGGLSSDLALQGFGHQARGVSLCLGALPTFPVSESCDSLSSSCTWSPGSSVSLQDILPSVFPKSLPGGKCFSWEVRPQPVFRMLISCELLGPSRAAGCVYCIPGSRQLGGTLKKKAVLFSASTLEFCTQNSTPSEQDRVFASQFQLESLNLNEASLRNRNTRVLACNDPFYRCLCFFSCCWLKGRLAWFF